jgi:cytosine/adenosine deaminase-related metal-dependent hydrolase
MRTINRRTLFKTGAALAVTSLAGGCASSGSAEYGRGSQNLPRRDEFVVRGATVLTMDERLGDLERGDVHVRDGTIVAVAPRVVSDAPTIDGRDTICMPGFIDTHWHLWTSVCRALIQLDDPKRSYFPVTNALGQHYTPEDSYRSVRLGLSEALSAGATTVHNWAHNIRSPEHADAELRAMRDMGIRGRLAYGTPQGLPDSEPMELKGLERIQRQWMPNDGMLTLGICSRNVGDTTNPLRGNISVATARKDWGGARALGLPITMHTSGPSPVKLLEDAKLLGPDVQLVHPLLTTAEERRIMHERGVSYSTSPTGESRRPASAGVIQFGELLEAGVNTSLSMDNTSSYAADYFQCMRILYNLHQHRIGSRIPLTARRLVQLATIDGAVDLGIADRTGSLTPGKRADLILIRTGDINIAPMSDPYTALVSFAQPRNIDTVVVDGRIVRRGDVFTTLDYAKVLNDAAECVAGLRARAKWA